MRVRVRCCGVCRLDAALLSGSSAVAGVRTGGLPFGADGLQPRWPLVAGHQIVGIIDALGPETRDVVVGQRVAVSLIGGTCGSCQSCLTGRENLCKHAVLTGVHRDGGFADAVLADARAVIPLPASLVDEEVAPMLCSGPEAYRALRLADDAFRIGLFGIDERTELLAQLATLEGRELMGFVEEKDEDGAAFLGGLGAGWVGRIGASPPHALDAALVVSSDGRHVVEALRALGPGGVVICMNDSVSRIPGLAEGSLSGERSLRTIASATRKDAAEFIELAARLTLRPFVTSYPLADLGAALSDLARGAVGGAAVIRVAASAATTVTRNDAGRAVLDEVASSRVRRFSVRAPSTRRRAVT